MSGWRQSVVIEKFDDVLFECLLDRAAHDLNGLAAFVLKIPSGFEHHAHLVHKRLLCPVQQSSAMECAMPFAVSGHRLRREFHVQFSFRFW